MMAQRRNLTDRAKRYRAQATVTGPRRCVLCGSRSDIQVMHLSGNEDDGERANLAYGCRSCNGRLSAAFRKIGAGRLTNQYNPPRVKGVPTFEQYMWAVTHHHKGEHDEGGVVIHATPKHKRIEYARRIADAKRGRFEARYNPTRENLFGFGRPDARRTTPASGGIAFHQGRMSGKKKTASSSGGSYRGYRIGRTEDGEYFSSLDPDSHFSTKRGATALIDSYLRGRGNPERVGGEKISVINRRALEDELSRETDPRRRKVLEDRLRRMRATFRNPSKFDRCVKDVKAKGGDVNAYAVCTAEGTRNPAKRYYRGVDARGNEVYFRDSRKAGRLIRVSADEAELAVSTGQATLGHYDFKTKRFSSNPADASAKVFEDFHGYGPKEVVTVSKKIHYHSNLAALGVLVYLEVWGIDKQGHTLEGFKRAILATNEPRKGSKQQLFIEGGDQSVNLEDFGIDEPHERETLGKVLTVAYDTDKTHLGDEGGKAVYVHDFTTTNKNGKHVKVPEARLPQLIYDVRNELLLFSGGSYEILAEGINK